MLRRLCVDALAQRAEAPRDPVDEIAPFLRLELDALCVFVERLVELFIGLARLILNEIIHKHEAAVRRKVIEQRDERRALLLGELKKVAVRYHDERALGHHRHRLDRLVQLLHRQRLAAQAVVVELLKARGDELFFDLAEVVFAQIALLAVKDVDLTDIARAQVAF